MSGKAYNLNITVQTEPVVGTNANNKLKITFRGVYHNEKRGDLVRTVVAQGAAAEKIKDILVVGEAVRLRCLYDHAPARGQAKRGGEYLKVVDIPREAA